MSRLNVLFVCSRNQWRSPTAEKIYRSDSRLSVRSCGVSPKAKRHLTANDIKWADVIFVMEKKHRSRMIGQHHFLMSSEKVQVLDIPDDYQYMDPELIELLEERIEPCLKILLAGND